MRAKRVVAWRCGTHVLLFYRQYCMRYFLVVYLALLCRFPGVRYLPTGEICQLVRIIVGTFVVCRSKYVLSNNFLFCVCTICGIIVTV